MEVDRHRSPPTGNLINLELSQLASIIQTKSDDDIPGPSHLPDLKQLQELKSSLELTLKDFIQHEHHKHIYGAVYQS